MSSRQFAGELLALRFIFVNVDEVCHHDHDGTTAATVRPRTPTALQAVARLESFAAGNPTPAIRVVESETTVTAIREFHEKSEIGCIAEGSDAVLVKTPSGLLVVVAKGQITRILRVHDSRQNRMN